MDLKLSRKTALVLGSTKGIGLATAVMLAEEGCNIILHGRNKNALHEIQVKIRYANPKIQVQVEVCDLSDSDAISKLVNKIKNKELIVDILINNSGGPAVKSLDSTSIQDWKLESEKMFFPIIELTSVSVKMMQERQWGRIINIVSSGVLQPLPELGVSNTLRSAIVSWSKTLSNEVAAQGITVNSVIPGRINTDRLRAVDSARASNLGLTILEFQKRSYESIPLGRYGEPEEIARAICFLASGGASYITGAMLRVDGGFIKSL